MPAPALGPVDPSMAIQPPGSGALSFGTPPTTAAGFAGYGLDPQTMAMLYGQPGPQSPYSKKLDEASAQILGDPSQLGGALSASQDKYDAAVQNKLAAMRRAADMIANTRGTANTPLMKFAAGLSSSPWIGTALGNAFGSSADEINKQREAERLIAEHVGNLGIEEGSTEMGAALEGQGSIEKRLSLAGQLENQAGNIQGRSDLANARNRSALLNYAGRITVADINADKNRYKFNGNDPNDPTTGHYLDQRTGEVKLGPASTGTGASSTRLSHFDQMQQAWLALYPGDKAGALDYASGHRTLTPQEMYRSARTLAGRELGAGADPQDIEDATNKIYGSMAHPPGAPDNAPPPATPNGGPPHSQMTPQEMQQSLANAKAAIARNPAARQQIIDRLKQAGIPAVGL